MRQNGNRDGRYEEQIMPGTECNRLYGWPDARELFIVWRLHRRCGDWERTERTIYAVLSIGRSIGAERGIASPAAVAGQWWPASDPPPTRRPSNFKLRRQRDGDSTRFWRDRAATRPRRSIMYRSVLNNAADRSANEITSVPIKIIGTGQQRPHYDAIVVTGNVLSLAPTTYRDSGVL